MENKLKALDISCYKALTGFNCASNQLNTLNISKNVELGALYCYDNLLTELDITTNRKLRSLFCSRNQIQGAAMAALIDNLPEVESGWISLCDHRESDEGNLYTSEQAMIIKAKGWRIYDYPLEE